MHSNLSKLFHLNIYLFIISLHIGFLLYTGSTFLAGIFGVEYIWIIYSVAAFFTLLLNFSITPILRNVQIEKLNNFCLIVAGANLILLSTTSWNFTIFLSYILYLTLSEYLVNLTSIMTEDISKNSVTGSIRGRFITMQSVAFLIAPFFTAFTITHFGLSKIFLVAGIFVFIAIIYFKIYIKNVPRIIIPDKNLRNAIRKIWRNYDIKISVFSLISLHLFYLVLVIYMPFKMESVGIAFTTYLSVLLPIALLPFLVVPSMLGHIEDKMRNEKTFMIIGLLGIILCLIVFSLVDTSYILIWAIILFITRIFTSMTETSINSYFFKKIGPSDTGVIAIFQSSISFAYLIFAPILSLILLYANLQTLFLSVSFFLCFMLILVSKIHNTDNYEKHKARKEIWKRTKRRTV